MNTDDWVRAHPYLEPVGRVRARIEAAAAAQPACASVPVWEDYASDFRAGVPLLKSDDAKVDLEPGGWAVVSVVERLASDAAGDAFAAEAAALGRELRTGPNASRRVVDWLLGEEALTLCSPGLLRCIGWTAMAAFLAPLGGPYTAWRDEEKWQKNYCPTCGSGPAMAQLIGNDPGRMRWLACGLCRSRWRYGRTICPFCENNAHRAAAAIVQGESGLRIDYCESCKGYLKTYDGQGNEDVMLADWTTLHLDVAAHDRGLVRKAASLYELGALLPARLETGGSRAPA
jgi:FdhE protein